MTFVFPTKGYHELSEGQQAHYSLHKWQSNFIGYCNWTSANITLYRTLDKSKWVLVSILSKKVCVLQTNQQWIQSNTNVIDLFKFS